MKSKTMNLCRVGALAGLTALLVACGDDVTNTDVTNVTGAKTVADLAAAGKCDSSALGEIVLNAEDGALYVCNGKKWASTMGEGGESGCDLNSIEVDGVEGVEIVCGNAKDTVLNGKKGDKGGSGAPGDSGTSCVGNKIAEGLQIVCGGVALDTLTDGAVGSQCTAEKIAEGVVVSCDGAVVDTIRNGRDGAAGTSCTAEPFDDGVESGVVVSCGGAVIDTIRNGHDGTGCVGNRIAEGLEIVCDGVALDTLVDGMKGDPGDDCTGRKIDGGVEISCGGVIVDTLRSASSVRFCGDVVYDATAKLCDTRDSSLYDLVRIGNQTWMKQNLNFDYKIDGVSYGSYCYQDKADTCAKYGRLYTWAAAMDTATTGCGYGLLCEASGSRPQGICPDGSHLPDTAEMNELLAAVAENLDTAGTAMKTTAGWLNGVMGSNSSGFTWLPAGYRSTNGTGNGALLSQGHLWSSVQRSSSNRNAYRWSVTDTQENVISANDDKRYGYSVRCVKNED
ncbi:MAG: hypothetical protein J6T45_05505 [Fibrobacterales bacterium]|nr:hypothetical protein [Fibrobacterales bacterium]